MIGLEIHVQLKTKSKLFCSCDWNSVCEVCLGEPGAKPQLNKKALDLALKIAKGLKCKINQPFFFSRKSYFYPDLPKNFQITQYEAPIGENGKFYYDFDRFVRIRRVHLEEDPGKIIHLKDQIMVDYSRSGIPLVEIVTEPDLNETNVKQFLTHLILYLDYLDALGGSIRADVNVSVEGGERVEIKNVSGRKNIEKVIKYEITRQRLVLKSGGKVERETRSWDETNEKTFRLRKKEYEEDYGYIFEPNLPIYEYDIKENIREQPIFLIKSLMKKYKFKYKLAESLVFSGKFYYELFEKYKNKYNLNNLVSLILALNGYSKKYKIKVEKKHIEDFEKILDWVQFRKISLLLGKKMILKSLFGENINLPQKINPENLIRKVIENNPKAINDYKKGKKEAINYLVGEVMKKAQYSIDPKLVRKKLLDLIQ